jgi:hypothetical protein
MVSDSLFIVIDLVDIHFFMLTVIGNHSLTGTKSHKVKACPA